MVVGLWYGFKHEIIEKQEEGTTMNIISIDGACYHNGQDDGYSCGACAVIRNDEENTFTAKDLYTGAIIDEGGTNQRGELRGLQIALEFIVDHPGNYLIVTDSEYIYNAMTRGWINGWRCNKWLTSTGAPVKNQDIWKTIFHLMCIIETVCEDSPCFYHIKGHIIPFGKATRNALLSKDPSGYELLVAIMDKFDSTFDPNDKRVVHAQQCSVRNNGFELAPDQLRRFVVLNMLADGVASYYLEDALPKLFRGYKEFYDLTDVSSDAPVDSQNTSRETQGSSVDPHTL